MRIAIPDITGTSLGHCIRQQPSSRPLLIAFSYIKGFGERCSALTKLLFNFALKSIKHFLAPPLTRFAAISKGTSRARCLSSAQSRQPSAHRAVKLSFARIAIRCISPPEFRAFDRISQHPAQSRERHVKPSLDHAQDHPGNVLCRRVIATIVSLSVVIPP